MITIYDLLVLARKEKWQSENIYIALGKKKLPSTIKECFKFLKDE